ncbi:MAG: hypothetical protein JXP72_00570 [Coriobacteriia bacterium]|nr:hypothetical protein [Coriobacteriia bacterium]
MIVLASHSRILHATVAIALTVSLLLAAGCTGAATESADDDDGVLGVEEPVVTHPPLPEVDRVLGIHDLGDGRIRAVGLIQYRANEGASWCLVEGTPGEEPPADAPVIVVIANMADLDAACSTASALAYAEGVLIEDDGSYPGQPMDAEFVARAD